MDSAEVIVLLGGIAAIVAILWFFFGPRTTSAAELTKSGVQEINVTVKGGYSPDTIIVHAGSPVRLNFYRGETASCSEQLILSDFGISQFLPAHQTTSVDFTPQAPGEHTFTCGMGMLRGRIIVR